jgi:hypothetical protein
MVILLVVESLQYKTLFTALLIGAVVFQKSTDGVKPVKDLNLSNISEVVKTKNTEHLNS